MGGPASRYGLRLSPEMHGLFTIGAQITQLGGSRTSETEPGNRHGNGDIDAHLADIDTVLEITSIAAVLSEERDTVAIGVGVDEFDRFVEGIHRDNAQHRAEDFFLINGDVGLYTGKHRGPHEVALPVPLALDASPIQQNPGALFHTFLYEAFHSLTCLWRDQRAEVGFTVRSRVNFQLFGALDEVGNPITGFAHENGDGSSHAALSCCTEGRAHQLIERNLAVG